MISISVNSKVPAAEPGQLIACISLTPTKKLAARVTFEAQAGYEDFSRRLEQGHLKAPYLTASQPPLLALPGAAESCRPDGEKIKTLAASALRVARERKASNLVFLLDTPRGADAAGDVAEGLALWAYNFNKYKKSSGDIAGPDVTLVVPSAKRLKASAAVKRSLALCESVNRARDLVNEPGSVATPAEIERRAQAVAERAGLEIEVLGAKQLKQEGYQGLIHVGRGAEIAPRMIILRYSPKKARSGAHLGLLGKGITFDTGGVSIKPAAKMWEMKGDMSGAAAVLHAIEAIALAKSRQRVTAVIVTAQNYVDAKAIVPGDIMTARNGKTVHIDNTDAEGRLVLSDGLWRMGEEGATHVVDVATLTGSIVRALGTSVSGGFGNDRFIDRIVRIAETVGEPMWKMPLVEEYRELLDCDIADLNNIGSTPNGGSITAALFLREFVPEGVSWAHLDIAGTFIQSGARKYLGAGATGVMTKTLAALAASMSEKGK